MMSYPTLLTPSCRNLRDVFDQFASLGKLSLTNFEHACSHFGLQISPEGCTSIFSEFNKSRDKKLFYHEFCLIFACHLINPRIGVKKKSYEYEVFLGGACNPTTWRRDLAVPFLDEAGISYYNPQVSEWYPELVEIESRAKASSHVFLFVFEIWKTRAITSFVELAFLVAQNANIVLAVIENPPCDSLVIAGEQVLPCEQACLEQARDYICQFSKRRGISVFYQLQEALEYVKKSVLEHRELMQRRQKQNFSSLPISEQQLIERISNVRKMFNSLDTVSPGCVSISQARYGLHRLNADFPCHSTFREESLKTVNFEQFCLAFASYLFQHTRPTTSNTDTVSEENRENAELRSGASLRHTRSLYVHRNDRVQQRSLKTLASSGSFDHGTGTTNMDSPRRRRLPLSLSFHEQSGVNANPQANRPVNAFVSWINGLRKRRVSDYCTFTDEPGCQPVYNLYVCGDLYDGAPGPEPQSDKDPLSQLRSLSVFMANDSDVRDPAGTTDWERQKSWARAHSQLLLYIVSSNSFSLPIMIEAAFAIGCGLPVVLCIEQLAINESTPVADGSVHVTTVTSTNRDFSGQPDWLKNKRLRPGRRVESLESQRIESASSSFGYSSTSASLSGNWIKQASCPNEGLTGFNLSDISGSSVESNSSSVVTSPICPGVISSDLNPSVDSGLGLNSDSTELFDEPAELDGACTNLARDSRREKSVSISPIQEKYLLPNVWEDSVLSLIVSNSAAKDHNRGRVYLTSIAKEMQVPCASSVTQALEVCFSIISGYDSRSVPQSSS